MLDQWIASRIGASGPLTREALSAWQLARLRAVTAYVRARSSFYRRRLPEGELRSLDDFAAFPFTTPDDLRRFHRELLCVSPDQVDRIVTLRTSGSSGEPKRLCFTRADQDRTAQYFGRGMAEFIRPGERVMSLFPGESPGSLNDLLGRGLSEELGSPLLVRFPAPPDGCDAVLEDILRERVTALVGSASLLLPLVRRSAETGRAGALARQVDSVLLAAEYVPEEVRQELVRVWRCRVNEHYGMTETALGGAVGCPVPGGYHIWASDLYYEIVDPDTGLPLPEGEEGETVVTTLMREAMPLIRYRTGDISRFVPGPCPCGSVLPRLERVRSRPQPKKFVPRAVPDAL